MDKSEVIKILRNEELCVKTADACERDCGKCPLVMDSGKIIEAYDTAIEILSKPEQKTGKWLPEFDGAFTGGAYWFRCSECGRIVPDVRNGGWDYCPKCGARNV